MKEVNNTSANNFKTIKIMFIVISVIIVLFTLNGYMLTSKEGGAVPLTAFESFYFYIITIGIALYKISKNKNANIVIILSILTYAWTYFLVQQMIKYITQVNIIVEPFFYIYLSSSIFLIISLFINEKKQVNNEKTINPENTNIGIESSLNKDNFIFANFVLGLKGIPLDTETLLVNNIPDNSLDLIYAINNNNQTIKVPINNIKSISYKTNMRLQNFSKKVESNEMKSLLLSAVVFGGSPMLQLAGNSVFNSLFDGISNNYDKVNFNAYFEITIETFINNQEIKFVLNTTSNPEIFIKQINDTISKNKL